MTINEDFFDDNILSDEIELEDIKTDKETNLSKYGYYLQFIFSPYDDVSKSNPYIYNIQKLKDKVKYIFETIGFFKNFYISDITLSSPNYELYDKKFEEPYPVDFDIHEYYGEKRWGNFYPEFIFKIYFDTFKCSSFDRFLKNVHKLRDGISNSICTNSRSSVTYEFFDIKVNKTITYEVSGWFSNGVLERLYNTVMNPVIKIRDDNSNDDKYLQYIFNKVDLNKYSKLLVKFAKEKYGFKIKVKTIYNDPRFIKRDLIYIAVTLDSDKKTVDLKELEECIFNCYFNFMPYEYFYYIKTAVVVCPSMKITNEQPTNKKYEKEYMHIFNEHTSKGSYVTDLFAEHPRSMWRIRKCDYYRYGSGHSFYIIVTDKHWKVLQKIDNVRFGMHIPMELSRFVLDELPLLQKKFDKNDKKK